MSLTFGLIQEMRPFQTSAKQSPGLYCKTIVSMKEAQIEPHPELFQGQRTTAIRRRSTNHYKTIYVGLREQA